MGPSLGLQHLVWASFPPVIHVSSLAPFPHSAFWLKDLLGPLGSLLGTPRKAGAFQAEGIESLSPFRTSPCGGGSEIGTQNGALVNETKD